MKRKGDNKKGKHLQKRKSKSKESPDSTPYISESKEEETGKNSNFISKYSGMIARIFCKQKKQKQSALVDEEVCIPEVTLNHRTLVTSSRGFDEEIKTYQGQKTPSLPDQKSAQMLEKSVPASGSQTSVQTSKKITDPSVVQESSRENRALVRSQIFFNLSLGILFSNITKLFANIGYSFEDEYYKYTEKSTALSLYLLLDNISGLLSELQLIQKSTKFNVIVHRDEALFKTWADKFKKYKRNQKGSESVVLIVLEKILKTFKLDEEKNTIIESFDATLELRIINELANEQQEVEDSQGSQARLLHLNNASQDLAVEYEKAIQTFLGTPIEQIPFGKTPLVSIDLPKLLPPN